MSKGWHWGEELALIQRVLPRPTNWYPVAAKASSEQQAYKRQMFHDWARWARGPRLQPESTWQRCARIQRDAEEFAYKEWCRRGFR